MNNDLDNSKNMHTEMFKIIHSKAKKMPEVLDAYLEKNPSLGQYFVKGYNNNNSEAKTPYAVIYLSKVINAMTVEKKLRAAKVTKIFIKHNLPLLTPLVKSQFHYLNFLDFVLGKDDLQFVKMVAPEILHTMQEKYPEQWEAEVNKVIERHRKKQTVAKTSGGIQFLIEYMETSKLYEFQKECEQKQNISLEKNTRRKNIL